MMIQYKYRSNQRDQQLAGMRAAVAAALFLAGLCLCALLSGCQETASQLSPSGIVYDDAAEAGGWDSLSQEEIEANLNQQVEEGYINISMNASPVFEDGRAEGNLMIVNETVNRYPQQVVINRNDTGETIYTSAAIPVGSKIAADALDVDLEAGSYDCTVMFHSLDPDTGAILGSAGANITITVQN